VAIGSTAARLRSKCTLVIDHGRNNAGPRPESHGTSNADFKRELAAAT
jgi:hypothetical protein